MLCQPQSVNKWKKDDYGIIGNWTGGKKESSMDSLNCKNKIQILIGRQANSLGEK